MGKTSAQQSRRKKENKRKVKQNKEKRLPGRALALLQKLTSREVAKEVFHSIKEKKSIAGVETINAEFAG